MADENGQLQVTEEKIVAADNEIAAGMWGAEKQDEAKKPEAKPDGGSLPNADTKPDAKPEGDESVFDESVYLKDNYGYESPEVLKNELRELKELREKAKTPAEIKFANEETKKFLSYFTEEGKEEELLTHLQQKKMIERAEKSNIENTKEATELLQIYYKLKYKDFDEEDVKGHFNDQYSKPVRPKQSDDQDENEYKEQVNEWQAKCDAIDRRIIRDAKMVKPDFTQFKSQIVLKDILPKNEPAVAKQQTQEELDAIKKATDRFISDVETDLKSLNEFSLTYKDEAVEIPVNYVLTAEEKLKVSNQLKDFATGNYDANVIFALRWVNEDGSLNVSRMTRDLAYLNNREKIEKKFVDDAVGKRMDEYTKGKKNIHLDNKSASGNGSLDAAKALEQVEAAIWEGKK